MKIAIAQFELSKNSDLNFEKAVESIINAARKNVKLIVFPELQFSPFFPQYKDYKADKYALPIDHVYINAIRSCCKENNIASVLNFYLKEGSKKFNASPVISNEGEIMGVSKMVHVAQKKFYFEQSYYASSDSGFKVYDVNGVKVGVVICFDRHYPESIRSCVLQGANLIVIPSANKVSEVSEIHEWELRVPAVQNGVYIALANRVGQENEMRFNGESIIVNPLGGVVSRANDTEQLIIRDLEMSLVKESQSRNQYLKLRNKDFCTFV